MIACRVHAPQPDGHRAHGRGRGTAREGDRAPTAVRRGHSRPSVAPDGATRARISARGVVERAWLHPQLPHPGDVGATRASVVTTSFTVVAVAVGVVVWMSVRVAGSYWEGCSRHRLVRLANDSRSASPYRARRSVRSSWCCSGFRSRSCAEEARPLCSAAVTEPINPDLRHVVPGRRGTAYTRIRRRRASRAGRATDRVLTEPSLAPLDWSVRWKRESCCCSTATCPPKRPLPQRAGDRQRRRRAERITSLSRRRDAWLSKQTCSGVDVDALRCFIPPRPEGSRCRR